MPPLLCSSLEAMSTLDYRNHNQKLVRNALLRSTSKELSLHLPFALVFFDSWLFAHNEIFHELISSEEMGQNPVSAFWHQQPLVVIDMRMLTADRWAVFTDRRCLKKTAENNLVQGGDSPPSCQKWGWITDKMRRSLTNYWWSTHLVVMLSDFFIVRSV